MALPKINTFPKYSLTIPSSGKKHNYRPFLTKEQKVLLIALETQDEKQILNAITDTIESCVDNIDLGKLTTFDVEYIFTQLRSKSVGEKSNVGVKCTNCDHVNNVTVNIESIKINIPDKVNFVIKLNSQYSLKMKYPSYMYMLNNDILKKPNNTAEMLIELVIGCLDSLMTDDEIISFSEEPIEEIKSFIDSLTSEQFTTIMGFVNSIPKLRHTLQFSCSECGTSNNQELVGINSFF